MTLMMIVELIYFYDNNVDGDYTSNAVMRIMITHNNNNDTKKNYDNISMHYQYSLCAPLPLV